MHRITGGPGEGSEQLATFDTMIILAKDGSQGPYLTPELQLDRVEGIFIRCLRLSEQVTRNAVAGYRLVEMLREVFLRQTHPQWNFAIKVGMAWGDFALYQDGSTTIRNFVAVPGGHAGFPTPEQVAVAAKLSRICR